MAIYLEKVQTMKVTNPIYARSFAHSLSEKLMEQGVQRVKHSHLLALHEKLIEQKLAFPGFNPRKRNAAAALVYETLVGLGARVSKKTAFQAAQAVLHDRTPFLRKPMFVDKKDVDNHRVLEGLNHNDSYWCETQWLPWMFEDGQTLIIEIEKVLADMEQSPMRRAAMQSEEVKEIEAYIQALYTDFFVQTEYISEVAIGLKTLEENNPFLSRVKVALAKFSMHFNLGGNIVIGYKLNTISAMQTLVREVFVDEVSSVLQNTSFKIRLNVEQ